MAALDEGSFSEIALIGITLAGGAEVQFASRIEEFDPAEGDKDNTYVAMVNGGRVMKRTPQGDIELTMKLYEVSIDAGTSLAQLYHGTTDSTAPLTSTNSRIRNRFQVCILWTDDTAATTASGTTATGSAARRITFKDLRITSYKLAWEDKTLVVNATFKGGAYNLSATGLITHESTKAADAAGLPAVGSYT